MERTKRYWIAMAASLLGYAGFLLVLRAFGEPADPVVRNLLLGAGVSWPIAWFCALRFPGAPGRWLRRRWYVALYLAGFIAIPDYSANRLTIAYFAVGLLWFAVWCIRNHDPDAEDDGGVYGIGNPHASSLQHIRRMNAPHDERY
ncbi:hypothetical protein [Pukyongiella litopenaei]|uniref:hypothetical protein n=1 Tax=Pukyongiella litopenaei TaxID=2605946 RepID=UPI001B80AB44|nr:hypothetical protein [Pukyongiella litopenaei]